MAQILSNKQWINTPAENIVERARGTLNYGDGRVVENSPHRMKFWSDKASYPYKSHDLWFITENIRWGYLSGDLDSKKLVDAVNREDLWKEAAKEAGIATADIPNSTSRGVETFFDGKTFDPDNPEAYLNSLAIKRV
jgi:nitrate/nitrite transport system substrate-binding protein